ncbi:hypothetical protein N7468_006635 [Penicillium chermesinum]|uniref:Uncharacterized protein n=1 Tax=Penicillium chermesinum TaxID=63820 RepID=A0A9W9TLC9_9EURO|nr:uncharacterized protein N7468_006635 [Penicillium chermesinum]KAJ5225410.1 hypothetical protein N7468_006635 [Penicillium chermesinum]
MATGCVGRGGCRRDENLKKTVKAVCVWAPQSRDRGRRSGDSEAKREGQVINGRQIWGRPDKGGGGGQKKYVDESAAPSWELQSLDNAPKQSSSFSTNSRNPHRAIPSSK